MSAKPGREAFSAAEWQVIKKHRTPRQVQRFLTAMPYNRERTGSTLRSFRQVLRCGEAHCLEAALVAAVILEQHNYPPILLSLASQDKLDHVIFIFQEGGRWGSVARSRDTGLHGRQPIFRNLRTLTWSYFDPYVDDTGRITGHGATDLSSLGAYDWRFSKKNIWKVERHLCEIPHQLLPSSAKRYESLRARFREFRQQHPGQSPTYFNGRDQWMF